jgi:ribonuclease VapC
LIAVDSSVLVAIFRREPETDAFIGLLDRSGKACLSIVSLVETMSVLCSRRVGGTREQVGQLVEALRISVAEVDLSQRSHALDALLRFGKGRHPAALNLGDCFSYALAKSLGAPLLFKGDDFARTDIVPAWTAPR